MYGGSDQQAATDVHSWNMSCAAIDRLWKKNVLFDILHK